MKYRNSVLMASEIRSLNIKKDDVMGFDYQWEKGTDNHYLTLNGERIISFGSSRHRRKSFDKIRRMGLGFGWKVPIPTDEEEGMSFSLAYNGTRLGEVAEPKAKLKNKS